MYIQRASKVKRWNSPPGRETVFTGHISCFDLRLVMPSPIHK